MPLPLVSLLCLTALILPLPSVLAWAKHEKVLLQDIQTITLYKDRYTNARRTSPIRQLVCTGGTAGCSAYIPSVVQCQNKGGDGFDVQMHLPKDVWPSQPEPHIQETTNSS